jgi:hypothetical protein
MRLFLTHMPCAHTSSYMYAKSMHQFLTHILSACINSLRICWSYIKWTFEKWKNWCSCWACALGTDAYGQGAQIVPNKYALVSNPYAQCFLHKGRSIRIRKSIFFHNFKVHKTAKVWKITIDTNKWSQKFHNSTKSFFWSKFKKTSLKLDCAYV